MHHQLFLTFLLFATWVSLLPASDLKRTDQIYCQEGQYFDDNLRKCDWCSSICSRFYLSLKDTCLEKCPDQYAEIFTSTFKPPSSTTTERPPSSTTGKPQPQQSTDKQDISAVVIVAPLAVLAIIALVAGSCCCCKPWWHRQRNKLCRKHKRNPDVEMNNMEPRAEDRLLPERGHNQIPNGNLHPGQRVQVHVQPNQVPEEVEPNNGNLQDINHGEDPRDQLKDQNEVVENDVVTNEMGEVQPDLEGERGEDEMRNEDNKAQPGEASGDVGLQTLNALDSGPPGRSMHQPEQDPQGAECRRSASPIPEIRKQEQPVQDPNNKDHLMDHLLSPPVLLEQRPVSPPRGVQPSQDPFNREIPAMAVRNITPPMKRMRIDADQTNPKAVE